MFSRSSSASNSFRSSAASILLSDVPMMLPGAAALISLWRLKPEFYGEQPDFALYVLRALKEAVHELGHSLGLQHCPRSLCVMHFSNSIFDTDKKQSFFCDQCYLQAAIAITNSG
jgi:archaemetzincin